MSTNIDDDDAPPELVDVSAMPGDQPESTEEEQTPRVPITLVTGTINFRQRNIELTLIGRISWGGKNNFVKLYSHRETWKEDCSDYEWFVSRC